MQLFMPYESLCDSAQCLDDDRQGNQIWREVYTIANGGWRHHPGSKIWYPKYKYAMAMYCLYGLQEMYNRGYNHPRWIDYYNEMADTEPYTGVPDIVGNERFHASHRSQLLLKNYYWYIKFGWTEEPGAIPYIWEN